MLTTRLTYTFVLASSLLVAPAHAFGAVPACVDMDMDAPSFSMLMDQLAAQILAGQMQGFRKGSGLVHRPRAYAAPPPKLLPPAPSLATRAQPT